MLQNLSNNKLTKTPALQKIIAWGGLAALIYGGMKLFNYVAPTIIEFGISAWQSLLIILPLAGVLGWFALSYKTVYLWYLGFCKKVTAAFIKMDPLSVMDGYLIILKRKFANLEQVVLTLSGKQVKLQRLIADKTKEASEYERIAIAAQKQGERGAATVNSGKALQLKRTVEIYRPIYEKYAKNLDFLTQLKENWSTSIDTLGFTIQNKREEFENLKDMFKGLKSAEDFMGSDSAEAQAYIMSVQALEAEVSHTIAYIDDFEKKAKPIMTNMKVGKQADEDEALKYLESLVKDSNLELPSFEYIPFETIKIEQNNSSNQINKYNL